MREKWVQLEEFPVYAVSNYGRVMNVNSDTIKVPSPNQQGIPSINFFRDGYQFRRAIGLLVAKTFLPEPRHEAFDTPINLDGDRLNNHVDNLEWRPRWFAQKYHAQYRESMAFGYRAGVRIIDTGEVFVNVRDCAMQYGLLEKDIILAAHNNKPVFPTGHYFRIVTQ